jgi:hypothetical protein
MYTRENAVTTAARQPRRNSPATTAPAITA